MTQRHNRLPVIDDAIRRYELQQDRYRKLVGHIGEAVQRELSERGILSTVQWRAKSPESLRRKLHKTEYRTRLLDADQALAAVHDLAAVRVCTYRDADRGRALEVVQVMFDVDPVSIQVKDVDRPARADTSRWYRATHLQLRLRADRLTAELRSLAQDSCEVQICSLLQHAFNEVEHDIAYKPTVRPPAGVLDLLHRFGEWREAGDQLIDSIISTDEAFRAELEHRPLDEFEAFVADVAARLPIDRADPKLSDLHRALVGAGIRQGGELWSEVRLDDFHVADELIYALCAALEQAYRILGPRVFAPLLMDVNSTADRLLVAFLPAFATALASTPDPRLSAICKAYLTITSEPGQPR